MPSVADPPLDTSQFFLRRLHSLLGIIPLGVFLFLHLGTNSLIAVSTPEHDLFQIQVNNIHALGPLLIPVEILFILAPLAFHAAVGVKIWLESKPNVAQYPYGGNIRYTLQRISGVIALLFIVFHLWHMHWLGRPFEGGFFDHEDAGASAAAAIQRYAWAPWVYAVGVVAACYHLANGIWAALVTWGVTIGPRSQRGAGWICAAFGTALAFTGLAAVVGMARHEIRPPQDSAQEPPAAGAGIDRPGPDARSPGGQVTHG